MNSVILSLLLAVVLSNQQCGEIGLAHPEKVSPASEVPSTPAPTPPPSNGGGGTGGQTCTVSRTKTYFDHSRVRSDGREYGGIMPQPSIKASDMQIQTDPADGKTYLYVTGGRKIFIYDVDTDDARLPLPGRGRRNQDEVTPIGQYAWPWTASPEYGDHYWDDATKIWVTPDSKTVVQGWWGAWVPGRVLLYDVSNKHHVIPIPHHLDIGPTYKMLGISTESHHYAIALTTTGIKIIDVTNPRTAGIVKTIDDEGYVNALAQFPYVIFYKKRTGARGARIYDFSNPRAPVFVRDAPELSNVLAETHGRLFSLSTDRTTNTTMSPMEFRIWDGFPQNLNLSNRFSLGNKMERGPSPLTITKCFATLGLKSNLSTALTTMMEVLDFRNPDNIKSLGLLPASPRNLPLAQYADSLQPYPSYPDDRVTVFHPDGKRFYRGMWSVLESYSIDCHL